MKKNLLRWTLVLSVLMIGNGTTAAESDFDFNRDIRPLLSRNCFACHGPDEDARQAELRLDDADDAKMDRGGYRVIHEGKPDTSALIERIESRDPDLQMPPPDSGHRLTQSEKKSLRSWVLAGARYDVHWSFVPPKKTPPPQVQQLDWPSHPMDQFVLAKLESMKLQPSPAADRFQWLRRVSLDLIGLPPTPEQVDEFATDSSDSAFDTAVDQLLMSQSFGEHWARMWLDLARYADTKGYEKDRPREIWRYRDWVIDALNADMSFDQFTIEQLAGDLLNNPTTDQYLATAFHRNTMTNEEGGTDDEEFRIKAVKDRVDTTLQVWMGLTMGCAKCHSHKFDPISQHDYYRMLAIFNQTQDSDRGDEFPVAETPTLAHLQQIEVLENVADDFEQRLKNVPESVSSELHSELKVLRDSLADRRKSIPKTPIMRELASDKQRETRVHQRGNFLDPGDIVQPQVPELFGKLPTDAKPNRLGVAKWIMQPSNPLTSRVMVNRVWARLFGTGIVETEEDFGSQGTPPLHPELLDWLAVDFRENGWSLKNLLRTIVLSSTYRQTSAVTPEVLAADPQNRYLTRGPRFRLPAETIRDQALAASGLLSRKVGGPSVMPPQPPGVWRSTYSGLEWKNAVGADRYRRAIYTYWKRTSPYPAMMTFDVGSGEVCQIRRVRTNTPLQAFVTLNDTAYVEAAGALSQRMAEVDGKIFARLSYGFRCVLTRPPTDQELARLARFYATMRNDFDEDKPAADELIKTAGLTEGDPALIAVANVLLNLDEALMKP